MSFEEDFKKAVIDFSEKDYSIYLNNIKSMRAKAKEVVVHYLFSSFLKTNSTIVKKIVLEKCESILIDEEFVCKEKRMVHVDFFINDRVFIEVKLKSLMKIDEIDYPVARVRKYGTEKLRYVGDDRKLKYLTRDGGEGYCVNFSKESKHFCIIKYLNGDRFLLKN